MSTCPLCETQIDEDFGIATCPQCGAVVSIDLDGLAVVAGTELDAQAAPAAEIESEREYEIDEPEPEYEIDSSEQFNSSTVEFEQEMPEIPVEQSFLEGSDHSGLEDASFTDGHVAEPTLQDDEVEEAAEPSENTFSGEVMVDQSGTAPMAASASMADLSQFANSLDGDVNEGLLRYSICIEGIDTAEIRMALKEAMTDRRLIWEPEEVFKSLKNGKIIIDNLTSIKASIVLQRIRHLPVEIKWTQHAVHQV